MVTMNGAKIVVKYLQNEGVKYVFGIPGGDLLPFFDALYDETSIQTIITRHEQSAAHMADGFARMTGIPAVCCGTVGPGGTNLVTGVASAYMDSSPMIAITAQGSTAGFGKSALQEASGEMHSVSHHEIFRSITKWSTMAIRTEKLPEIMQNAFRIALTGRYGPVHIDLPMDVLTNVIDAKMPPLPPCKYRPMKTTGGDPVLIDEAAGLLLKSNNPLLFIGGGALWSQATPELMELAELLSIPVITTLMGKSAFPEDHPLCLGVAGIYGTDPANAFLFSNNVDVLLALGVKFHQFTTWAWASIVPKAKIIQVDIDPSEIGRNYPIEIGITGDAKLVLRDLIAAIKSAVKKEKYRNLPRLNEIEKIKNEFRKMIEPELASDNVPIKPQRVIREIRKYLDRDAIVMADSGSSFAWTERYLETYLPRTFVMDGGLATMGSGTAMAIGVKAAMPTRQVLCLTGDGSFLMTCKDIITAVRYNWPVVWCVLEDGAFGMLRHMQMLLFEKRYAGTILVNPDFVKMAESFGAYGERVEKPSEIRPALVNAFKSGKPAVLDIIIDGDEVHPGVIKRIEMAKKLSLA